MKHGRFTIKKNSLQYENEEIVVVATFKEPVATCVEWRQGWTTLLWRLWNYPAMNNGITQL